MKRSRPPARRHSSSETFATPPSTVPTSAALRYGSIRPVSKANLELDTASFVAGVPNYHYVDGLVVTLKDGTERIPDDLIRNVIDYWESEFAACGL
jgi:hypothetical protein